MTESRLDDACVTILTLKKFAMEKLTSQSALRSVLLAERDEIPVADFLSRIPVWLTLLRQGEAQ
jgi:hypothetical protein